MPGLTIMDEEINRNRNGFKYPTRKPWLLIALIIVAVAVVIHHYRTRNGDKTAHPETPKTSSEAQKDRGPGKTSVGTTAGQVENAIDPVFGEMKKARTAEREGKLAEARTKYNEIYRQTTNTLARAQAETAIGRINVDLLFSPVLSSTKTNYVVKTGDSIDRIAGRFGTTADLIKRGNRILKPDLIKPGDEFMVFTGRFSIVVSKARNDLVLNLNGDFFKRYIVGTGKFGKTPVGDFVVKDRIEKPPWHRRDGKVIPYGDPDNILGTRWTGIRRG